MPALPPSRIEVANGGDRPIQVGSHYHFFETNEALIFDRDKARGCRLEHPGRHGGALRAGPAPRSLAGADLRQSHDLRLQAEGDGKTVGRGN